MGRIWMINRRGCGCVVWELSDGLVGGNSDIICCFEVLYQFLTRNFDTRFCKKLLSLIILMTTALS